MTDDEMIAAWKLCAPWHEPWLRQIMFGLEPDPPIPPEMKAWLDVHATKVLDDLLPNGIGELVSRARAAQGTHH